MAERTAFNWHCYLPGSRARASATGTACTVRTTRPAGCASTRPSCSSTRTPRRSRAHPLRPRERAAVRPRRRRRRPRPRRRRRRRRHPEVVVVDESFDWEDDRRPLQTRGTRPSSTRRTSRASRSSTTTSATISAEPTRVSRPTRRSVSRRTSVSPPSSCSRCTTSPTSRHLVDKGSVELLGLQLHRLLRPARPVRRDRERGEQVREFKGMVKALHRAGIEVILDVVYNHTAEGNQLGPMLVVPRRRQPVVLPALTRGSALLHRLHGHGEQPQPGRTRACCA